jgi:hypothetical protein
VYEDFTFDKSDLMSGAGDDWAYEHAGVYGWTTEFWDVIQQATGTKPSTYIWYTGPTEVEELAVYRWVQQHHPELYVDWTPFDHPQLGPVEIGGWDEVRVWQNAPGPRLLDEVRPHAEFAVYQALCSPLLAVPHTAVTRLADDLWRVEVGIANTGFLPTYVTERANRDRMVLPLVAELTGAEVVGGTARLELGQLGGRLQHRFAYGKNDGTPERVLAAWTIRAAAGTTVHVTATHQRAGQVELDIPLL